MIQIKKGELSQYDLPPIQLVQKNKKLFSIDNRRLLAFNMAGVEDYGRDIASLFTDRYELDLHSPARELRSVARQPNHMDLSGLNPKQINHDVERSIHRFEHMSTARQAELLTYNGLNIGTMFALPEAAGAIGRLGRYGRGFSPTEKIFTFGSTDRLQLEKLRTQYRQAANWVEPAEIKNQKLQEVVRGLYRNNAIIGSGSTADAVRVEKAFDGIKVGGNLHAQKAENAVRGLDNLLKSDVLSAHDHMIAVNVRLDLLDSLGDRLWYSQTNIPGI